jgi:HD superfamily phosphohydrolase
MISKEECERKIVRRMKLGRLPIIVIGSGVSDGAGVPLMENIHRYLKKKLSDCPKNACVEAALNLLDFIQSSSSPRSVSVRLYHLLQTSTDPNIRKIWKEFGLDLINGLDGKKRLYDLTPTAAHYWAGNLAINKRAIVISLNYDGLTRRAIETLSSTNPGDANKANVSRIISSYEEIQKYFTSTEGSQHGAGSVPIIKLRGDVFHAVCKTNRCPEVNRQVAIYELLNSTVADSDASKLLKCPVCNFSRELQISFPGVAGKELEIEQALVGFHEMLGTSFAGTIFVGFSGKWDERLVSYLVKRSAQLSAPVISFSHHETPAISRAAEEYDLIEYNYTPFTSGNETSEADLKQFLSIELNPLDSLMIAKHNDKYSFPSIAFKGLTDQMSIRLAPDRIVNIAGDAANMDSFTEVGGMASDLGVLERLKYCSQLGTKSSFLCEDKIRETHTRLVHSFRAALMSMVWYDALLTSVSSRKKWAFSQEARIALELAVLFHDARHLPFSHMMEEVFKELNWNASLKMNSSSFPQVTPRSDAHKEHDIQDLIWTNVGKSVNTTIPNLSTWWSHRVDQLQKGLTGNPWMEAIVDSALDADKIDYLFTDSKLTGQQVRLASLDSWLEDFLSGQSLTPEGLIKLEGESAFAALTLLQERMYLYRRLYLAPELRALEALVKYIVTLWLEWRVPEELRLVDRNGKLLLDNGEKIEDIREKKYNEAVKLLWGMFSRENPAEDELHAVKEMGEWLCESAFLDETAKDWVREAWKKLSEFIEPKVKEHKPSLVLARKKYLEVAPIGPLYVHSSHEKDIRKIVRRIRVNYPLIGLIDIVRYPKFLSTPSLRVVDWISEKPVFSEHFLVPGRNPSEWRRNKAATTPLHLCDFGSFEMQALQILIIDPWGESSGGASFIYEILKREFRKANIQIYESPEATLIAK